MRNTTHTVYKNADGIRVPSVTTFLGVLAKPALIDWAWNLGIQQIDYKKVKDTAADTGTLTHYLILCELKGIEPDLSEWAEEEVESTKHPMKCFHEWKEQHELEPILMEKPLVSEKHQFGGTPDFYGLVDGVKTLLDFKTSKAIYSEYSSQVAAYAVLLREHGHVVDDLEILRLPKDIDDEPEYEPVTDEDVWFTIFLDCQDIYVLRREMRKKRKDYIG